jgi:5-methylthioribose kinase
MEIDIEDLDALQRYLLSCRHVNPGEEVSLAKLSGGVSNRTVRVLWADGHGWVLKQALEKLRVDVDWFSSPDRIQIEAKALRWFNRFAPPGATPSFAWEDTANHLMAMEAIPEGHENWKTVLLREEIVPQHFEQFGWLLGTVHRQSSGSGTELRQMFGDTSYFETLRLQPYYLYAAQTTPAAAGFLKTLAQETLSHNLSLVHGDFSPKNTLLYRGKLILLDYEVVHWGEPAFDLGFALTHFLSKANHLPKSRARLADAATQFWEVYRKEIAPLEWANALELRVVSHTLGCLLARVAGKSPLEYLTRQETTRQRDITLVLVKNPPECVNDLVARFIEGIDACAEN